MNELDVVVVDDVPGAADDYAALIAARTGLRVASTLSGDEALELASKGNVPVFVLDARMPGKGGVELFAEIQAIDPHTRGILITGEATREEVGAGIGNFRAYLGKEEINKLPSTVLHEYVDYQRSSVVDIAGSITLLVKRKGWLGRDTVRYQLLRSVLLSESYNEENDWKDVVVLAAGQQETQSLETSATRTVAFESETTARVATKLGLSETRLSKLQAELQSELTHRSKLTETDSSNIKQTRTISYALAAPPVNPDDLHVVLRRIQRADEKFRYRVEVQVECSCCGLTKILTETVLLRTGRVCLRQKDQLSDGSERNRSLGAS